MDYDQAIKSFDLRSKQLTGQAWLFLALVVMLLAAGALAVGYARTLTAKDIATLTVDEKMAAIRKEEDRITARSVELNSNIKKQCIPVVEASLSKWLLTSPPIRPVAAGGSPAIPPPPVYLVEYPDPALTGDFVVAKVNELKNFVDPVRVRLEFPCGAVDFSVPKSDFSEFKSSLAGKALVDETIINSFKEKDSLVARLDAMKKIENQTSLEKLESEVGLLNKKEPSTSVKDGGAKDGNELFLTLLQTSITRFGLLAVIGFFVSILISLYRYNIRLAAFYTARADALRLIVPPVEARDFVLLAAALSPTVEFGKAPQPPITQLVDLIKSAKEAGK